ncbi:excinuclease ATPase subunit [Parascardovia denticolens IPLA 20019]|uniref:hypothetical protein n=1 Tax=Parascardovia denticolens TaxID=78258 RepID=UPI0002669E13|nr:hypothetical protein [Parascardovia denticolens]EIT87941.1 excinuclease ATPase subunit [Parascardovia denticolens IPLA 20019]
MTGSSAAAPVVSKIPVAILVRGARVHNLQKVDVDIPLNKIVGIAGVSGSGKSSLALGVLYAEGSRRYLESLSTYTRRRMTQAARADVDEVRYIPAALALHQRPGVPGIRSTFGTMSELLNSLRLMFSRLASHRCPQGHYCPPSFAVATMQEITCPVCAEKFYGPGAEDLAFNSRGACPRCGGTGITRTVNEAALVPNEELTIDQGAVAVWGTLMWALMKDVCREMGVRTDVPFKDLTEAEKEIVYHGPAEKRHIIYVNPKTQQSAEMDFTYYSAVHTVENALSKVKDDKGMKRIERFLTEGVCPDCQGTRLSEAARAPRIGDVDLGQAAAMTLTQLVSWVSSVPGSLPQEMRPMGESICESFLDVSRRLLDLGLGYLSLDRAASTLSTGERQRVQLARAVRNRTTGVLYVLDEPSIGLHPYNLQGLTGVMDDLVADGNSVVLVDHVIQVLSHADWLIELGPGAGADGGHVIGQGTVPQVAGSSSSVIGPFLWKHLTEGDHLTGDRSSRQRELIADDHLFDLGSITLTTDAIHTVRPLEVSIPQSRLTVVTGVSGSGKTTLILESLIPALMAKISKQKLPRHVVSLQAEGIRQVKLIDATPIGINVRSTVATYAGVHDELRKVYARTALAKQSGYKAGDFSYNTGDLRCPTCDGTGRISLDVQFLPDVDVTCPDCRGSRYSAKAHEVVKAMKDGKDYSLPDLMNMSVDQVLVACKGLSLLQRRLQVLHDLGLGYLTLGEDTPGLSGGEAQRLKLASEMGKGQTGSVFVFDEPTIGLHPKDVRTLLDVFETLIQQGATVIVIEHDLDLIRNADYIVDMGPGGGEEGGRVVAVGSPQEIRRSAESITGRYI